MQLIKNILTLPFVIIGFVVMALYSAFDPELEH
jgi:hypothetical protein